MVRRARRAACGSSSPSALIRTGLALPLASLALLCDAAKASASTQTITTTYQYNADGAPTAVTTQVDARAGEAVLSRPGAGPSKTTAWLSELPPEAQGEGVTRIALEAESMKIEPPMQTRRDIKASGENMVLTPRSQGGPMGPLGESVKGGALTGTFTVERPGSYILMARCRWPDGGRWW